MSIGPILPGRVPDALTGARLRDYIQNSTRQLSRLQDQVATGQKFLRPGEDPAAASQTIRLQSSLEHQSQFQSNVRLDGSMLAVTEGSLASVNDGLNRAKTLLMTGLNDATTSTERKALAQEAGSLLRSVFNTANTKHRDRYLFGGSFSRELPFEEIAGGTIRYNGDRHRIDSYLDLHALQANNADGATAFGGLTEPVGRDVNPALTTDTKISDLNGGRGVELGPVVVTVDDGINPPQTETVDLSGAETIGDLETLLEDAFAASPPTLDVDIDPGTNSGLRLRPGGGAGTVAVSDIEGSTVAADLGIASAPVAEINGGDLDPALTLLTPLSAFNGGTGIGPTAGFGLQVTNGAATKTVDIDGAQTVEGLFNALKAENLNLHLDINEAGNGLAISSRLSGANFAIGENGGNNATRLGIRTMTAKTRLADLNFGKGVPVNERDENGDLLPAEITIQRRDGTTTTTVDLKGLQTVQDVLDALNAVDADLSASLNGVGNGISITDASGTDPLVVEENNVSTALGIAGEETGSDPTVPLVGEDVNQRRSDGVISLMIRLKEALGNNDRRALNELGPLIDAELERFSLVRGEVATRQKLLEQTETRLADEELKLQKQLSEEFDADLAETVTQIAHLRGTLEATLQTAATTLRTSLLDFL